MAIELTAASAAIKGIVRVLGFSRKAQILRAIRADIQLYDLLSKYEGLQGPAADLAQLVKLETQDLLTRRRAVLLRRYDWGYLAVGIFMAALVALPLIWLIIPRNWWQWLLAIFVGTVTLIIFLMTITTFRKQVDLPENDVKLNNGSVSIPENGLSNQMNETVLNELLPKEKDVSQL